MPGRILFPFRSSFYYFNVRVGSIMVVAGDGLLSLVRLALVLTGVEMFDKEHRFINMDVQRKGIKNSLQRSLRIESTGVPIACRGNLNKQTPATPGANGALACHVPVLHLAVLSEHNLPQKKARTHRHLCSHYGIMPILLERCA
ncbi:uncharacterized protein LOC133521796 isoform X2 [Cydia pomonella]|uniref:uncharacterized protein LOC133521796 isoform X2 n=1 Tax=Cydia pomonella TaxID=82600 RepID=UPI002ADE5CDE|nr:uncharacterized protein LOC133521796 isoform X2 [Cydia pomonella]